MSFLVLPLLQRRGASLALRGRFENLRVGRVRISFRPRIWTAGEQLQENGKGVATPLPFCRVATRAHKFDAMARPLPRGRAFSP